MLIFLKYGFACSPIVSSCALLGHWQVESSHSALMLYVQYIFAYTHGNFKIIYFWETF